jgi:Tol biopolymer transport system component
LAYIFRVCGAVAISVAAVVSSGTVAQAAEPGTTIRVSVRSDGSEGEYFGSREPAISADGRYVVFSSGDELAADDTNALDDVYLRDTVTGVTELISVGPSGTSVLGSSNRPKVSADGRYVAFASDAPLTTDTPWNGGTFVRDRQTGVTTRIGPASYLFEGPDMSADGNFVVFPTVAGAVPEDTNVSVDIYLWNRRNGKLSLVSTKADGTPASGDSSSPSVSDNGRYVTYRTRASDLNGGVYGNRVVLTDRQTKATTVVSPLLAADGGDVGAPVISGDGRFVAYSQNEAQWVTDIKLWQRTTGTTTVASVNTSGQAGTGVSLNPHLSRTGRYVAFWSAAPDLVANPPAAPMSVYRFDRQTGRNVLAMTPPDNAFYGSEQADISDDGRFVATETRSATLVPGDTNDQFDVFRTEVS